MGKLILYGVEPSPPVRACKMTLDALAVQYEFRLVNLMAGDHKSEAFLRKNPQHTIPLLEDGEHCLWESHAIMTYLVSKYGKDEHDQLYPKDLLRRALVDQRLHFETGVLFQGCLRNIAVPIYYKNATEVPREKIDAIYEAYEFLESFLLQIGGDYMCGSTLTIADFSIVSTVSSLVGLAPLLPTKYPKLSAWLERMTNLPNYASTNGNGAQMLIESFNEKIKKIV